MARYMIYEYGNLGSWNRDDIIESCLSPVQGFVIADDTDLAAVSDNRVLGRSSNGAVLCRAVLQRPH